MDDCEPFLKKDQSGFQEELLLHQQGKIGLQFWKDTAKDFSKGLLCEMLSHLKGSTFEQRWLPPTTCSCSIKLDNWICLVCFIHIHTFNYVKLEFSCTLSNFSTGWWDKNNQLSPRKCSLRDQERKRSRGFATSRAFGMVGSWAKGEEAKKQDLLELTPAQKTMPLN